MAFLLLAPGYSIHNHDGPPEPPLGTLHPQFFLAQQGRSNLPAACPRSHSITWSENLLFLPECHPSQLTYSAFYIWKWRVKCMKFNRGNISDDRARRRISTNSRVMIQLLTNRDGRELVPIADTQFIILTILLSSIVNPKYDILPANRLK